MEKVILLTVPHSFCKYDSAYERRCDRRALQAAKVLANFFKNKKVMVISNDSIDRKTLDTNRAQSRQTKYRKNITNILDKYDVLWVLDIHSFPNYDFGHGLNFVFLDNISPTTTIEYKIFNQILPDMENAAILEGSLSNDIQYEARKKGIPSILIEVSERSELLSTKELNKNMNLIAKQVYKYIDIKYNLHTD